MREVPDLPTFTNGGVVLLLLVLLVCAAVVALEAHR